MSDVTPDGRPRGWPYDPTDVVPAGGDAEGRTPGDTGTADEQNRADRDPGEPDTHDIGYTTPTGEKEPTA